MSRKLITHSGFFHADDVLSYMVLSRVFPDHILIRTRDQVEFDSATTDDIVFDVGMRYDPQANRFDHHMSDKPLRENGYPYSSFGLVWKYYGRRYLEILQQCADEYCDALHRKIDQEIVFFIAGADNGVTPEGRTTGPISFGSIVDDFKPSFDDESASFDERFVSAMGTVATLFDNRVKTISAQMRSEVVVRDAYMRRSDPRVLELPGPMEWESVLRALNDMNVLYAIYPAQGKWNCVAMKVQRGNFTNRKSLPPEWGGLRDEDLARVTGVEDAHFVHTGLFFAVAASRDGILQLVNMALERDCDPIFELPFDQQRPARWR